LLGQLTMMIKPGDLRQSVSVVEQSHPSRAESGFLAPSLAAADCWMTVVLIHR
jgi:hypothetical protein